MRLFRLCLRPRSIQGLTQFGLPSLNQSCEAGVGDGVFFLLRPQALEFEILRGQ